MNRINNFVHVCAYREIDESVYARFAHSFGNGLYINLQLAIVIA